MAYVTLTIIFLLFGAEFFGYIASDYKLKEIKETALELIQNKGGYTDEVAQKVEQLIEENNLEQYDVRVVEHPSATLQWQEPFDFRIEGKYLYRTLNFFGTGLGNIETQLASYGNGASQVYPHS
ncbi:DUF4320 family protein [Lysinibacillus sphaericus]|uniref:DUF4320 family protein n=1 Tax=Lysinibacillus sphaericus TaxID=1421 RepID=UPI003F7A22AF